MNDKLQLFEDQPIRTAWDNESEEWYFSIVDVVRVLTESKDPNAYWRKLKQRLQTVRARKELTDEWKAHGVQEGREYAILTDEVTKAWSGMTTRRYKDLKGLKKENLRDNMSTLELALNMLAEATTTELTRTQNPQGLTQNQAVAREGGGIAGNARKEIEARTGQPGITSKNAAKLNSVMTNLIENMAERTDQGDE